LSNVFHQICLPYFATMCSSSHKPLEISLKLGKRQLDYSSLLKCQGVSYVKQPVVSSSTEYTNLQLGITICFFLPPYPSGLPLNDRKIPSCVRKLPRLGVVNQKFFF